MDLDVAERTQLAADLLAVLDAAIPSSAALLRGSLAEGRADRYSDIDIIWDVPDANFAAVITGLPTILARVRPVASLRFDPDFQRSEKRRLVFVRFAETPLFWRVDLDVFAHSVGRDFTFDRGNPAARGASWSAAESSLANTIAAIKAHLRDRADEMDALLERAERRIDLPPAPSDTRDRIERLVAAAAAREPALASLATDIRRLITALL